MIEDIEDARGELWNIIDWMPKGWYRARLTEIANYIDLVEERL
jgi:hypothetical protein